MFCLHNFCHRITHFIFFLHFFFSSLPSFWFDLFVLVLFMFFFFHIGIPFFIQPHTHSVQILVKRILLSLILIKCNSSREVNLWSDEEVNKNRKFIMGNSTEIAYDKIEMVLFLPKSTCVSLASQTSRYERIHQNKRQCNDLLKMKFSMNEQAKLTKVWKSQSKKEKN